MMTDEMKRVLVFEAVTGGGFLEQPLEGSLLQEGSAMLQHLCQDLVATGIPQFSHHVMPELLRQAVGGTVCQIDLLVDHRLVSHPEFRCRMTSTLSRNPQGKISRDLPLQQWTGVRLEQSTVSRRVLTTSESWQVMDAEKPVRNAVSEHVVVPAFHAIHCRETLLEQLTTLAEVVDALWIIAPEPTLTEYLQWLIPWQHKWLNLPLAAAQFAENKSNYHPQVLGIGDWDGERLRFSHLAPSTDINGTQFAWKPVNRCGCDGVWRLEFPNPMVDLAQCLSQIEAWWPNVAPTEDTGTWMLTRWFPGTAASVSLFATGDAVYQFPACQQLMRSEPGPSLRSGRSWQMHYDGCRWATDRIQQTIQAGLPRLMQSLKWGGNGKTPVLKGWWGLDLIVDPEANSSRGLHCVDMNARLTSSYNLVRSLQFDDAH